MGPWVALALLGVNGDVDGLRLPNETVSIVAFADGAIHVVHTPRGVSGRQASLAATGVSTHPHCVIRETSRTYTVETSKCRATMDKSTGAVAFYDPKGRLLLSERDHTVGADGVVQRFRYDASEGIYGLGQHQQGLMNLNGNSVHLQQKNMEVGVPVLVSTKGYGLLWDNPSITDVSLGGGGQPIPASRLYDANGQRGALTMQRFDGIGFEKAVGSERDADLHHDWTNQPPEGLRKQNYSVRWTGTFETGAAGEYRFTAEGDDGIRLWIGDKQVVNDWASRPLASHTASVKLPAHTRVPIRMEFYQAGGEAIVGLSFLPPTTDPRPTMVWKSEGGNAVDYWFFAGSPAECVASYRQVTGAAPMFPRWSWGLWQCKERYQSQAELEDVAATYRRKQIPLDAIIQDWYYWDPQPWGSHSMDPKRYPDPKAMLADLHRENVHAIISVWGKFADGSANYESLKARGLLYPKTGDASYYDAFNPVARKAYWELMRDQLFTMGWDGWWLDATEPELGSQWGEFRNIKTALGPGKDVFNAYPLMTTKAVSEGSRAANPAKRAFILTRSAYAGQQRNSAVTWSGDITGTWDVFRAQVPAGLNFSASGIPYWNTDIGGFFGGNPSDAAYRELFLRWFQFGAFCPMFRIHGTNFGKEPWKFGPEAEAMLTDTIKLRYKLLPYIYSLSWDVTKRNDSMMRALAFEFPQDLRTHDVADQFMFGPSFLVNPVVQKGATKRKVYLPAAAKWIDFWTGKSLAGGQTVLADAPISRLPLFVRAGSIVPFGPDVQYSGQPSSEPLEVRVYPGADGKFTLYEDAGDGYGYEKGQHSEIAFAWDDKAKALTIGPRVGTFPGMEKKRVLRVSVQGTTPVTVDYTGQAKRVVAARQ